MPAPETATDLVALIDKSGLVESHRLKGYLEELRTRQSAPPSAKQCADSLVREGVLTPLQARLLLQGKWRNFFINEKYKLLDLLGTGGMGQVFLCEHKLMKRKVAVKVLPTAKAQDKSSLERFYREARAVAALDHPNIVRAHDVDSSGPLHFIVMEYVDGVSLQELVDRNGALGIARAANYVAQAALGLQHAHESGLVHRDVKPANLLLDRGGVVKVLDLGLARFFTDADDNLTRKHDTSAVMGTADYLAPEQATDCSGVDIRADIYALGATLYFLLAGRPPFFEGSLTQKLVWHQMREPMALDAVRADVPRKLAQVVQKMMAKDPRKRYQTPAEAVEALAGWAAAAIVVPTAEEMPETHAARGGDTTARLPSLLSYTAASRALPSHLLTSMGLRPKKPWRNRAKWAVLGAFLVGGLGTAAWLASSGSAKTPLRPADKSDPPTAEAPPPPVTWTRLVGTFPIHPKGADRVAVSPDGKFVLSGGFDGVVRLFDAGTFAPVHEFKGHKETVHFVNFSPDGRKAVSCGKDGTVRVWDLEQRKQLHELKAHGDAWSAAFTRDGRHILSAGADKLVKEWEAASGAFVREYRGHTAWINWLAVSPDGKSFATAAHDSTVRVWSLTDYKEVRKLAGHVKGVSTVAYSPDGKYLLTGSYDQTVRLWEADTGHLLHVYHGPVGSVWAVAFAPDGKRVLGAGGDKIVCVWDRDTGKLVESLGGHTGGVTGMAFLADGDQFATSCYDKNLRVWKLPESDNLASKLLPILGGNR